MFKVLAMLITGIITSFYFFPVTFSVLPTVNTKLMLAIVGLFLFVFQFALNKKDEVEGNYLSLTILAVVFSLICFFSTVLNGTMDYAYATYVISMFVWVFGAYAVSQLIKMLHGEISIVIIAHYLIALCVVQCIVAILIDNYVLVKRVADSIFLQDPDFFAKTKRLYGIGAALDTAGMRFSLVLVLIACLFIRIKNTVLQKYFVFYIVSYLVISIIGCIISRTTLVGILISLGLLCYKQLFCSVKERPFSMRSLIIGGGIAISAIVLTIYAYQTNEVAYKYFRFGFEGVFSLIEDGEWKVGSNEQLQSMIVFPETLKTWIIGDGYFNNPVAIDPYYVGQILGGYYMGTDIGYLRFIFYCGLLGLLAFSIFMYQSCRLCVAKYPSWKLPMLLLLVVHFVCWMKVATDCFLIYALFIVLDKKDDEAYNERIKSLE